MFASILVPVKLTEPDRARRSVELGSRLARDCNALLTLATITPHWVTIQDADYSWEARRRFEVQAVNPGLGRLKAQIDHPQCRTLSRWGSVPGSIIDIAEEIGADLIVLPAREPGVTDWLCRPDAVRIAATAGCSVFLVR